MRYAWYVLVACALVPNIVRAGVIINEIAWMGNVVSANDEWIELFNDGNDAVDITNWLLSAGDGEPSVALSGIIAAGGFFLLERTDDASAPEAPADQIYSGNTANTGETLVLKDSVGSTTDIVVGGLNWESVGGNNTTKHTAQRQPNGSWITGVPTPRSENSTEDTGAGSGSSGSIPKTTTPKVAGGYVQKVFAYAGEDTEEVVGADVFFEGYAVNQYNKSLSNPRFVWSFGDGQRRNGEKITHIFREPGIYTVVLKVHADNQKGEDTVLVSVFPSDVVITDVAWGENGFVEIRNGSKRELDMSEWRILGRRYDNERRIKTFIIPEDTRIAPQTAVRFSEETINLNLEQGDRVALLYRNGAEVAAYTKPLAEHALTNVVESNRISTTSVFPTPAEQINTIENPDWKKATSTSVVVPSISAPTVVLESLVDGDTDRFNALFFPFAGAIAVAIVGLLAWRRATFVRSEIGIETNDGRVLPDEFSVIDTTPKEP